MKKLRKIDGSCAVIALHYASGQDEETTLRICKLHDFNPDEGMDDESWREAAEDLGLKIRAVPLEPCKLRKFMREHKEGLFLVGTHDHLFVVDNGVIVDPRCAKLPGLDRIVKQAWTARKA